MNLRRKRRLYLVSLLLLGGIITVALVIYALRANIDLFYTPTEIFQGKGESQIKPEVGQRLRVGGMVLPGSVSRDGETLNVNFKIYDDQGVVAVSYKGILPDLFRENQGVVVQGMLGPDNRVLAQEVLAKHDENYTPPEVQDAMKKNHSSMPTAYSPQNIPF